MLLASVCALINTTAFAAAPISLPSIFSSLRILSCSVSVPKTDDISNSSPDWPVTVDAAATVLLAFKPILAIANVPSHCTLNTTIGSSHGWSLLGWRK